MRKLDIQAAPETAEMQQERIDLQQQLRSDCRVKELFDRFHVPARELSANAYMIDAWRRNAALCDGCRGLQECRQARRGLRAGLKYDGILKDTVDACPYQLQKEQREAHLAHYLVSDLGEEFAAVSFKDIRLDQESNAYVTVLRTVMQACDAGESIYLYGNMGSGKTYLAACAANQYARQGASVAFVHCPAFCERISRLQRTGEYRTEADRLSFAKFLVLDDIGAEEVTERSRAVMLAVLDARMRNHLPTWYTSNADFPALENHFLVTGKGKDTMEAQRLMERIRSASRPVLLLGDDRRMEDRSEG